MQVVRVSTINDVVVISFKPTAVVALSFFLALTPKERVQKTRPHWPQQELGNVRHVCAGAALKANANVSAEETCAGGGGASAALNAVELSLLHERGTCQRAQEI